VLWRLAWHPDPVGGGLAVGAGWLNIFVIGMFLLLTGIGQYIALVMLSVLPFGILFLAYVVGMIAAQRVMILAGGRIQGAAAEREARRAERAVMAPVVSALLWGALWLGVVVTKDVGERHQKLAQERVRAAERAAAHPAPPPLERRWEVELMPGTPGLPKVPSPPVLGPDGTIYVALDTALVAVAPSGEVKWRNTAIQTMSTPAAVARNGTIYVAGRNGSLYAVRPDGTLEWALSVSERGSRAELRAPAVGNDGTIYIGDMLGSYDDESTPPPLTAVSPNGTVRWRTRIGRGVGDVILPTPDGGLYVVGEGRNYHGTPDTLFGLDATGAIRFRKALSPLKSGSAGPVDGRDGTLYIARHGEVLAVRPPDSALKGIASKIGYLNTPVIRDDGLVFTSDGTTVVAREPDGGTRWVHDLVRLGDGEHSDGIALLSGGRRLVVSTSCRVVVLDADDGRELADYAPTINRANRAPEPRLRSPSRPAVAADGTIYVVDAYYRLYAIRSR
jgi:outer membrane protein assembly factor BamB